MGIFFVYVLKSSVCLVVFYLFYRLLLSRETFHRFNRIALLSILLLSVALPLLELGMVQETQMHHTVMTLQQWLLMADAMNSTATTGGQTEGVSLWMQGVLLVYMVGVLFFVTWNTYSLLQLGKLLRSGEKYRLSQRCDCITLTPCRRSELPEGRLHDICFPVSLNSESEATVIIHDNDLAPFSWMGYIVISWKDLEESGREVLTHELAHVRHCHSWDLLIADICVFIQWFNPASWLLKRELQAIHEYEADEMVIDGGVDAKKYQLLLIRKAVGTRVFSMANSFNHSKLKKRIGMMLKKKSNPWSRLKFLYVLPLAIIAVTAFARPEVTEKLTEISDVKVHDLATIVEKQVAVGGDHLIQSPQKTAGRADAVSIPEKVPLKSDVEAHAAEFPGGVSAMMSYLAENKHYPESAKAAGVEGRVIVQFTVDCKGNVTAPKVLRSVNKEIDAEAVRLIRSMPQWEPAESDNKPVATKMTLPVVFKIESSTDDQSTSKKTFYVDGVKQPVGYEKQLSKVDPSDIVSVNVVKSGNGAGSIYITTKRGSIGEDIVVHGHVKDAQGEPVVGALVAIEGGNTGTVTDLRGDFSIAVARNADLLISYIHMKSVKIKAKSDLMVTLKAE